MLNRVVQGKGIRKIKLASQSYLKNSILSYRVPVVPVVPKVPVVPVVPKVPVVPVVKVAVKVTVAKLADARAKLELVLAVTIAKSAVASNRFNSADVLPFARATV